MSHDNISHRSIQLVGSLTPKYNNDESTAIQQKMSGRYKQNNGSKYAIK